MKIFKNIFGKKDQIIMYTSSTCGYCAQIKEALDKANVKYVERDTKIFPKEWNKLIALTNMPVTPAISYKGRNLYPARDFPNPSHLVEMLSNNNGMMVSDDDPLTTIIERARTLNHQVNQAFQNLDKRLRLIEDVQQKILNKGKKKKTK